MHVTCRAVLTGVLAATFWLAGCGDDGDTIIIVGPPEQGDTDRSLDRKQSAPGVVLEILSVGGASGLDGDFRRGDRITVTFRLEKADGDPWFMNEMDIGRVHFAGPTFNYQRVIPEVDNLAERSSRNTDGSFRYTFQSDIPETYSPPYNDSPAFGVLDGELTGKPLQAGTYTLGLSFGWRYTVEGQAYLDLGEASRDVLLGGATTLRPRSITSQENCEVCHVDLRAHEGERGQYVQCLMCHTSGAEDGNDPAVAGGTPGVSIDSRVLTHKIHNAAHLPSVLGITVDADGAPDYGAAPRALQYADASGNLTDFSWVGFPVWPNRTLPREKNLGWSALNADQRRREDLLRKGVAACFVCHGDPDGDGPLEAPLDGELINAQPTRRGCGSCHDDIDWDLPYVNNGQTMPPQDNDGHCTGCHGFSGSPLAIIDGHLHPLNDPAVNIGLVITSLAVFEAGAHDGDGSFDVGEQMALRFDLTNDLGQPVDPATVVEVRVVVAGPTENQQLLLDAVLPAVTLSGPQPFLLPSVRRLEFVGDSTSALGDVFQTQDRPHLDGPGALTEVLVRSADGVVTSLAAGVAAGLNHVDVLDSSGFARDDVLVLDDGVPGREEYLRIQFVDDTRLWFSSPGNPSYKESTDLAHAVGATVTQVFLDTLAGGGVDYQLQAASGRITEVTEFGTGAAVLVSYTTHFVIPSVHGLPLNDSPGITEQHGEWSSKTLVPGTYSLALMARNTKITFFAGEINTYPIAAEAQRVEFQVQDAPVARPYDLIDSPAACNDCHQDLRFHAGEYRGYDSCLVCHGTAGAEDRPRYVAAGAPDSSGVEMNFRQLLHKIHRGLRLEADPGYFVVGEGGLSYPDNFEVSSFDTILFPVLPGHSAECVKCHGADNTAWMVPAGRDHPSEQDDPVRSWRAACMSCHDSAAALAHGDANTAQSGVESCVICHGPLEHEGVELVHRSR